MRKAVRKPKTDIPNISMEGAFSPVRGVGGGFFDL
jgi:hypothetical protein